VTTRFYNPTWGSCQLPHIYGSGATGQLSLPRGSTMGKKSYSQYVAMFRDQSFLDTQTSGYEQTEGETRCWSEDGGLSRVERTPLLAQFRWNRGWAFFCVW
jgi:hypothetical protein